MTEPTFGLTPHPFSQSELLLAAENYESQEALLTRLRQAFLASEMAVEDLAALLEVEPQEAADWISGDVDLHLSELRYLANALDAKITWNVKCAYTTYPQRFQKMHDAGLWQEMPGWNWNTADDLSVATKR
ncbi:helix-turn-helix transcriptional regulator [Frigoribacterium sp. VKM Ac-2530]|uniref:helix-turn-helix domain-containing protein n=1 Tax=Frigoribacterium sp. VKM Ac-2530 TaxID=2783822 RepID=UPI00188CD829|nr:helix-turn-helix transcriptional regulator [Frigoribacterium sp. VKM Ac-2530]MBF4578908.1 helix-turn-helix transcriptional regulator [Frigoribacterium sp. VKM Ac-2530]